MSLIATSHFNQTLKTATKCRPEVHTKICILVLHRLEGTVRQSGRWKSLPESREEGQNIWWSSREDKRRQSGDGAAEVKQFLLSNEQYNLPILCMYVSIM